jgi:hypothetical protein
MFHQLPCSDAGQAPVKVPK